MFVLRFKVCNYINKPYKFSLSFAVRIIMTKPAVKFKDIRPSCNISSLCVGSELGYVRKCFPPTTLPTTRTGTGVLVDEDEL